MNKMMNKIMKAGVFTAIGSVMLVVAGCLPSALSVNAARRSQPSFDGSAWVTYWDFDRGLKEAVQIQSQLNSVSYFAAAFDHNNKVMLMGPVSKFMGQKLIRYRAEIKKYLTVVNDVYKDVHNPKGESIEKDVNILAELFGSEETVKAHVRDLLDNVKKYRFDGLEIDYENIWKNRSVAVKYVAFLEILNAAAEKENIPLRVILEPGIPVADYKLPEGPEYIVMCYNLFGSHTSNGGPKADDRFLEKMLLKVKQLPRPHGVALAVGGCVWQEGRSPYYVTETEALQLGKTLKAEIKRDAASNAQYFIGKTAEGKTTECWFADARTVIAWKRQALDFGVDGISLWRLGGNYKIESYYPGIMK